MAQIPELDTLAARHPGFVIVGRVEPCRAECPRRGGQPFDIAGAPELPPDELREGGRGVFLIRRLMDEVESHRSPDGTNELRMLRRRVG